MYSQNDYRNYLEHSWGNSPEQKAREREYNHEYWLNNRDRVRAARAYVNRRLVNNQYSDSKAGMGQADERRRNATTEEERRAAIDQYNENARYSNQAVQMRYSMDRWAKKPVNDIEQFIANGKKAVNSILTKIKNQAINFYSKNEKLIGWGKKETGSNMPTNQSDLNTIARERARQTLNSTRLTRTFSGTQTTVGEARRRNSGGR